MKMILASDQSFLLKYGYDLIGIPKLELRIGYVTTASKVSRDKTFVYDAIQAMSKQNIVFEEIDIEGKSRDELSAFFANKNVIHIEGGNTFYLLKIVRETDFGSLLNELLLQGKTYIGTSAGAYIACPTIEVADWNETGRDRFGITDFTSLNLVPFLLKAHYQDNTYEVLKLKAKNINHQLKILKDGQGILVNENDYTFIGGEETVL